MQTIKINSKFSNVDNSKLNSIKNLAEEKWNQLYSKTGKGNDFLGWIDYPLNITDKFISEINEIADEIRDKATVLIVVGIGGSYLGAKSAIDSLRNAFVNEIGRKNNKLAIYFLGQNMSPAYIKELLEHIKGESVYVNVISKSGTTTEPAVAFRIIKEFMENEYKNDAAKRIIATTDEKRGALRTLATNEGYRTFVIPDDVGGRFSVITPVGLLPIACAGISINELMRGVKEATIRFKSNSSFEDNEALLYAALRNILYKDDKKIEILVNYDNRLDSIARWWMQLYAESEGKDGKGIFPCSLTFTTDLHSVGQYVQEGERSIFETVMSIMEDDNKIYVNSDKDNLDGLNYLAGKSIYEINQTAMKATMIAHYEGGVPNIELQIAKWDAYHLGYLYAFFMHAVAYSGYMLDVNPFDQPGVEAYKKNMFALLGKSGYEDLAEELKSKF